jgi:predicted phage terminase large subunit-like protein
MNELALDTYEDNIQRFRMLKYLCEHNSLAFNRVFHKVLCEEQFIVNLHHVIAAQVIDDIFAGKITRLIVNEPPRYTKTIQFVKHLIARGLAMYPRSRWMHLTGGDELAIDNSKDIKSIIESDLYQILWPTQLRNDSKSAGLWHTKTGGTVFAGSAAGQIMGFGAGYMMDNCISGALSIDDPIKPEDSFSDALRNKINKRFVSTAKTRCALPTTPIIITMQRIHKNDLSGFCLTGGTDETWDHLIFPSTIKDINVADEYPEEWTHGRPYKYKYPTGPLWEFKSDKEDQDRQRNANVYVFQSQQMQQPEEEGGGIFNDKWWMYYQSVDTVACTITLLDGTVLPYEFIGCVSDTALKKEEINDFQALSAWVKFPLGIALIDLIHKRMETPELLKEQKKFYDKYMYEHGRMNMGARERLIEDKASGTGLIQTIRNERGQNYIIGVPRSKDKVQRANDAAPSIEEGKVWLPKFAPYTTEFRDEFRQFSKQLTHKHDDMIDVTIDAIQRWITGKLRVQYGSWV